jgi:hypothetical protein
MVGSGDGREARDWPLFWALLLVAAACGARIVDGVCTQRSLDTATAALGAIALGAMWLAVTTVAHPT